MPLSRSERERIIDSRLKIQAVSHALHEVDPDKIPDIDKIQECLEDAEQTFHNALQPRSGQS